MSPQLLVSIVDDADAGPLSGIPPGLPDILDWGNRVAMDRVLDCTSGFVLGFAHSQG